MGFRLLHPFQQPIYRQRTGDEQRLAQQGSQGEDGVFIGQQLRLAHQRIHQVFGEEHANDIIYRFLIHRITRVMAGGDTLKQFGEWHIQGNGVDFHARLHDLFHIDVAEVEHAAQQALLVFLEHACLAAGVDEHFQLLSRMDRRMTGDRFKAEQAHDGVADAVHDVNHRTEDVEEPGRRAGDQHRG